MQKVKITDLLEAGVHFGHQTKRWNPKMKPYVYGAKNGISIINLTKTMHQISDACNFLQKIVADGGTVLFVGTKRQAQQIITEAAEKTKMFYVSERWMGGCLTNNSTIRKSIDKMRSSDKVIEAGEASGMKKKEISKLARNCEKLHRNLDGIAEMRNLPAVMVMVDVCDDKIAVNEAKKLNIPIVAIVDTNADPSPIDYPIAANDDAVKSIKIIFDLLVDSICVAQELYHKRVIEEKAQKAQAKAEAEANAKANADAAAEKAAENSDKNAEKVPAKRKPAAPKKVEKVETVEKTVKAPAPRRTKKSEASDAAAAEKPAEAKD
jgi:small subunit ribosomal protein S2